MKISANLLLLCLWLVSCQYQKEPSQIINGPMGQKLEKKLTPFIRQIMSDNDMESSIAVGVTRGDSVIYARAFGYANVDTKKPATIHTLYHQSSLSKPFVAMAIMKLVGQGKLSLDDFIVDHLPYFKLSDTTYTKINIKHLLTHSSGLPANIGKDEWENPRYDTEALEAYVRGIKNSKLLFEPGTRYSYSNVGYNVLGDVIAKASKVSFEEYMQEEIINPADLKNTTFTKPDNLPENWAVPHITGTTTQVWEHYPYNRMYAPSSALSSSVLDMSKWGIINLNKGQSENQEILDSATYSLITAPSMDTPWGEKIGLSWFLQHYEGMKTIMHSGEDIGFSSQIILYPEEDICIVVMANRAYSQTPRIANATMEIIKDMEVKPYKISGMFPFSKAWNEKGFDNAKRVWKQLLGDTTDIYYADEWEMNGLGHGLIFTKEYEKAKMVFDFNIELFPNSANVYDSYGDALLAEGDTTRAIEYFQKSLEVNPNFPDPKPKLEALKNKNPPPKR